MPHPSERTVNGRTHNYHAEASILTGKLHLPLANEIKPQSHAKLAQEGGYLSERSKDYHLEGVIAYDKAYTQVAGNRSDKPDQGWTTLTTTVIEGLNVLEIVTADRIVGQVITEHPLEGYVPTVSFLGSRFENLRIAGFPVEVDMDLGLLGPRPLDDTAYSVKSDLVARVSKVLGGLRERAELPAKLRERYNQLSSTVGIAHEEVECSLVTRAAGAYPGASMAHVISIPDFGTIELGKVRICHEDFKKEASVPKKTTVHLTMINFHFGCFVSGSSSLCVSSGNGSTVP